MFFACGINYKTAPITLREKIAVSVQPPLLHHFMQDKILDEGMILSTCHRTELYGETCHPEQLLPHLAHHLHLPLDILSPCWYLRTEHQGLQHTLRVASGLDSMMLGEPQIFGQLKQAYMEASTIGSVKSSLKTIFPFIFKSVKQIRHQSGINQYAISMAKAAALRILKTFPSPHTLTVLMIGNGEMANTITKYLFNAGLRQFMISSRTEAHAQSFLEKYQASFIPVTHIPLYLTKADIIITATACPVPFITYDMAAAALIQRTHQPFYLLDLALPRNIAPEVAHLPGLTLCHLDDLKSECDENLSCRQSAATRAEILIEDSVKEWLKYTKKQHAKQLIINYRQHMRHLTEIELSRALRALQKGDSDETVLTHLSHRLYKKLTHFPSMTLKKAALAGHHDLLHFAHNLLQTSYETND